jgi:hypothetical protein
MNIKREVERLKERARARREAQASVCTCQPIMLISGEPTEEQQQELDARRPCKLHSEAVRVYFLPPMPEWMKTGGQRPPREIKE